MLQVKIFYVPLFGNEQEVEEVNSFLRGHKVLKIEKDLVDYQGSKAFVFYIEYFEGVLSFPDLDKKKEKDKERKDYRDILSPEEFVIFDNLRKARKLLSDEKGVNLFVIFNNEELSKMSKLERIDVKSIASIAGISKERVEKYAAPIVESYHKIVSDPLVVSQTENKTTIQEPILSVQDNNNSKDTPF